MRDGDPRARDRDGEVTGEGWGHHQREMGTSLTSNGDGDPSPARGGDLWARGGDGNITGEGRGPTSEDGVGDVTGKGWGWGHHQRGKGTHQ